jgi:hypothetical protein
MVAVRDKIVAGRVVRLIERARRRAGSVGRRADLDAGRDPRRSLGGRVVTARNRWACCILGEPNVREAAAMFFALAVQATKA